jgi:hypothetical protein
MFGGLNILIALMHTSLGTILYELVFKTPLWKGKDDADHFVQIIMVSWSSYSSQSKFIGTPTQSDYWGIPNENANLIK